MLIGTAATAYRRTEGPIDSSAIQPTGMDAYYTAASDSVGEALPRADARRLARRSDRKQLRSAMWAFAGVPWVPELTIDHVEWDVMWRVTFGGMSADMRNRLDHPADGFVWR